MTRTFLWTTAAVFLFFGCWGLISPAAMVSNFGVMLGGPDGQTMIRASYGGFLIGEGALFAWCAASPQRLRFGLIAVVVLTLPILLSRLLGIALDGATSPYHWTYLAVETVGVGAALILLRRGSM